MSIYTAEELAEQTARRAALEASYGAGNVWSTDEVQQAFEIHGFGAPCVSVTRKSDGAKGSLYFDHRPRFYYDFQPR